MDNNSESEAVDTKKLIEQKTRLEWQLKCLNVGVKGVKHRIDNIVKKLKKRK